MQHRYEHRLLEEAEAGRKFLQQLRKPHDNDIELDEPIDLDYLANGKEKKVSLRASLERLIEEYLRKITADSDEYEIESRQRRHSHNMSIIDMLIAATAASYSSAAGTTTTTFDSALGTLPTIFEDDEYDDDEEEEDDNVGRIDGGEMSGDDNINEDDENVAQSGSGASQDNVDSNEEGRDGNENVVVINGDGDDNDDENSNEDNDDEVIVENDVERIELGSRKINVTSTHGHGRKGSATKSSSDHEALRSGGKKKSKNRKNNVPAPCFDNKRRIAHLDKIELESSLRNLTDREFNIRNLLNYR